MGTKHKEEDPIFLLGKLPLFVEFEETNRVDPYLEDQTMAIEPLTENMALLQENEEKNHEM
jgi:hypothetical protein